jgi:hypothetical protein
MGGSSGHNPKNKNGVSLRNAIRHYYDYIKTAIFGFLRPAFFPVFGLKGWPQGFDYD